MIKGGFSFIEELLSGTDQSWFNPFGLFLYRGQVGSACLLVLFKHLYMRGLMGQREKLKEGRGFYSSAFF